MKHLTATISAALLVALLTTASALAAQEQVVPQMSGGCGAGQPEQTAGQRPMMGRGMMGQGAMGMMCPMMGCMMGMPGMMGEGKDPKAMARMLQMRGEILKAVGEVPLKYGNATAEEGK